MPKIVRRPKAKKPKPLFGFNTKQRGPPTRRWGWKNYDTDAWIGFDLDVMTLDPTPELTKAIDRGGLKEGYKHIKKVVSRKRKK